MASAAPIASAATTGALLPAAILTLVILMVVPVPAAALDLFFILNIAVSLLVLLVALNAIRPLDFSSFPTVLLFATLLRLSLNVASTRVVLVHGHEGTGAAGHVIEAFGQFLIGGDYIVGLFVFSILMIINLVVITKGAGRVSEVSARFTLDALPGKQMAIDADLNAGLLTPDEARARRVEVATEADFYGSMDGASKFVKGDAVAGVLILAVNMIGGMILGVVSHDLPVGEAAATYFVLTVGDGLVAQVPALLLSIASAVIVTRVASPLDLAGQVTSQLASKRAWPAVAGILALMALLPGMPHFLLLAAAGGAGTVAWRLRGPVAGVVVPDMPSDPSEIAWDDVADSAPVGLELGYGLIGLVDPRQNAPLMARITAVRRQISADAGFVLPLVRVRDDIALAPNSYRIRIGGVICGEDEAWPEDWLAIVGDAAMPDLAGRQALDPAYGVAALWVSEADRDAAAAMGLAVVDASTVIATHLSSLLGAELPRMLGFDEAQKLIDHLQGQAPQLAAALAPKIIPLGTVVAVLRGLLDEDVPIRDFRRIAEALAAVAGRSSDPGELIELVRPALGSLIVQRLSGLREPLKLLTLDGEIERQLILGVRDNPSDPCFADPVGGRALIAGLERAVAQLAEAGTNLAESCAIVVSPPVRRAVRALTRTRLPGLAILSVSELPPGKAIDMVAVIGGEGN